MKAVSGQTVRCLLVVALVVAIASPLAWSQQSVRLYAGDRAEVRRSGDSVVEVKLGQPANKVDGIDIVPQPPTNRVRQICCTTSCETDRDARVDILRSEVLGRYGASWLPTSNHTRLDFPGISFMFNADGHVVRICISPR